MSLRDAEKTKNINAVEANSLEPEQAIRLSLPVNQFTNQQISKEPRLDACASCEPMRRGCMWVRSRVNQPSRARYEEPDGNSGMPRRLGPGLLLATALGSGAFAQSASAQAPSRFDGEYVG